MSAKPAILFFPCARPGSLPPAYDLDPEDSGAIVGGVELALALYISANAADLVAHYAQQERADLLAPARPVRDAGGRVVGCRAFDTTPAGALALATPPTPPTDVPPAPYYPRPADWPREWPWERAPKQPRTDAVAGPAGVVLCDLDTTPAALIPVPGVPGLDYSYADMGMVDPEPVIDPEPPAPQPALTVTYGQRSLPAEIVRRDSGRVYARVNISTSERELWYCIPIAQIVTKGKAA